MVGQGICGTFLSWWLEQAGLSFVVIDEARPYTASKAAAGLINPVTGRRIVTTWMIDELLPFAEEAYRQMGQALRITCMQPATLVDFFPTAQMRLAFLKRFEEDPSYLQLPPDEHAYDEFFRYGLGYGSISPCYLVDLPGLLAGSRKRISEKGVLLEERFDPEDLIVEGFPDRPGSKIHYRDIHAGQVIFCDGIESFTNPYFSRLPFAPNKGEALIVEMPGLSHAEGAGSREFPQIQTVFKKGISIAPWKEDLYWVGASHEWAFDHGQPTAAFREKTEAILHEWLKVPFKTVEHIASVRPATLERRPFVGFHPLYPAVGILNGMGTKGCSLAPYFAYQLVQFITKGIPIRPDADVNRFSGILSRK